MGFEWARARRRRSGSSAPWDPPGGLGLSDSALSKQLSTLELAGYVQIRRGFVGKRPRTSASLSTAGRQAFEQHVAALQRIIARSQQNGDAGPAAEAARGILGR